MDLSKYQQDWMALNVIDYADKTYQYRQQVGADDVKELAASIKANGQDIPIVCRRMQDGRLQIVCGFRRYTAAQLLGWEKLKTIIVPFNDLSDNVARLLSARENMQRAQYNSLDKMFMCKKLSDQGVSNVEIGEIIGKSENQVRRYIKVAEAPREVQDKVKSGEVTIKEAGNEQIAPKGEQNVDNTKYNVKSSRNTLSVKLKVEINAQNEATIEAFLSEVKKAWKDALKKNQQADARRRKRTAANLDHHIDQLHQAIDSLNTESQKN
jgi:ParB/RepB/Spo0J family partition protein